MPYIWTLRAGVRGTSLPAFSYRVIPLKSSQIIMKNSLRRIFGPVMLLVCLTLSAVPAMAWDDVGHKITAYIAWTRMTPQTRENVIRILREAPEDAQLSTFYMNYGAEPETVRKREFFEIVATWADIVRDRDFPTRYKKYHKGNWHYGDIFWRQVDGKVEPASGFEDNGQAIERLIAFDKVVRDASASDKEKAIAIAWIMHIGGDIHQPLHTSARVTDLEPKGDQGGNLFLLTPKETKRADQLNLHWLWDSIVGRNTPLKGSECDRQYIESVADQMMKKYPFRKVQGRMELGDYTAWQKESFAFNNTDVFTPDLKRFEAPSVRYKRNAYRVAQQQLTLAGYRLGETMNAVFGGARTTTAGS